MCTPALGTFREVITTIYYVNSWDTSRIFTVHRKGTEKQRSSKGVFNHDTMSGFIITLICQFTHYSLVTSEYSALIVLHIILSNCYASGLLRFFQLESDPACLSFRMVEGFAPLCALKEHSKRTALPPLSVGSDQVSLFLVYPSN